MPVPKPRLTGSSVLADASAIAKTVYGLRNDGFYSADFVDFGTIIEHGIIGDIILVPGGKEVPDAMMEPLKCLINEGAISVWNERPPTIRVPASMSASQWAPPGMFNEKRSKHVDAQCEAARIASAELAFGRPGMLLVRQRELYDAIARPREEHWMCDLLENHRQLTEAIYTFKKGAHLPGYILVKVPPFAHLVLRKANSYEEAIEIMLTYRYKCTPLRAAEHELYEIMSSRDIGAMDKAKARDRYLRGWKGLVEACGETSTAQMAFASSQAQFLRHVQQTAFALAKKDGEEAIHHGRGAVEKLLEHFSAEDWDHRHPWTLRPVRLAARECLTAPSQAMQDAAHRIFKIPRSVVEARMRLLAMQIAA